MSPLIQPDSLQKILQKPDLALLDATYFLPSEGQDARDRFTHAHLPGAHFFDIDKVADPQSSLPHMLPTPDDFAKAMSEMGIGPETLVIVYDQRGIFSAPRVWWMLRVFGHNNVKVLDGGLPAWLKAGGLAEVGPDQTAAPTRFTSRFQSDMVRSIFDIQANLATHAAKLLDARAAARFHAQMPEPRAGMKSGHIPGAINIPFTSLLKDGRYLSPDELRQRFLASGIDGTFPLIASCGSGITACVIALGLVLAGLPEAAIYDGSWSEWGGRDDTFIEV